MLVVVVSVVSQLAIDFMGAPIFGAATKAPHFH